MHTQGCEFDRLYRQAHGYRHDSRFKDAAHFFYRASQEQGIRESDRIEALFWYGTCLHHTGRFNEAIVIFSDIFDMCKRKKEFLFRAYSAYYFRIHSIIGMQQFHPSPHVIPNILAEIEEGLSWLITIGQWNWRSFLLIDKAFLKHTQGYNEEALDLAEEAYSLSRQGEVGYIDGFYNAAVARYACILGCYDRAFKVLCEVKWQDNDPHTRILVLTEYIRLYVSMDPPHPDEAVETAYKLQPLISSIQSPRVRFEALIQMAYAFLLKGFYDEAYRVLEELHLHATHADGHQYGMYFLRKASDCFSQCQCLIGTYDGKNESLANQLAIWQVECIEKANCLFL